MIAVGFIEALLFSSVCYFTVFILFIKS